MKTISVTATEFKARCLALMDGNDTVVITKRGKVVARLTPEKPYRPMMGRDKGKVFEVVDLDKFSLEADWELD